MLNLQSLKREKQAIISIQSMLKNFTDSIDLSSDKIDRLKFQSLYKKYKSLYLDFLEKDSDNYFGEYRDSHAVDYTTIHLNMKAARNMQQKGSWDWEYLEYCIEELETERSLLKEASYNETLEDSFQ